MATLMSPGFTDSDQTTFPVLVGPDLTANGGSDAFVATCRQQGRNVLDFLTCCCLALGADMPLTSLNLSAE